MSLLKSFMMEKPKIMYATIKGSLTESPYGVFSGFSSSNYLKLQQQLDATKPFELVAKINISSIGSPYTVFGTSTSTYIQLGVRGTGVAMMLLGTGGSSFSIGTLYSSTVLSTDTNYWIKGKFTGTKYELYLSTDGTTWILEDSIESSTLISNSPITIQIGNGHTANWYLRGSIDLNRSYIKIDDTKYKLQAVVGYTVVGSPTITDGVVSGFSSSDYLKVSPFIISATDVIEEKISFTTDTISGNQWILSRSQNSVLLGVYINSSGKLRIPFVENNGSIIYCNLDYVLSDNTSYSVTIVRKADGTLISTLYNNQGTVLETLSTTAQYAFTGTTDMFIGVTASGGHGIVFNGSIDMNNTFIKINNKLWFNGQEG